MIYCILILINNINNCCALFFCNYWFRTYKKNNNSLYEHIRTCLSMILFSFSCEWSHNPTALYSISLHFFSSYFGTLPLLFTLFRFTVTFIPSWSLYHVTHITSPKFHFYSHTPLLSSSLLFFCINDTPITSLSSEPIWCWNAEGGPDTRTHGAAQERECWKVQNHSDSDVHKRLLWGACSR